MQPAGAPQTTDVHGREPDLEKGNLNGPAGLGLAACGGRADFVRPAEHAKRCDEAVGRDHDGLGGKINGLKNQ
jgi:hypothetical protein